MSRRLITSGFLSPMCLRHLERRRLGDRRGRGHEQGHAHDAVAVLLDLGPQEAGRALGQRHFQALLDGVFDVQLVDVLNLRRVAQGAPAVVITGLAILRARTRCCRSDCTPARRNRAARGITVPRAVARVRVTDDAVALALREESRVDELPGRDGGVVAAAFEDLLEEEHGALFQLAGLLTQRPVLLERDQLHEAVGPMKVCRAVFTPATLL